MAAATLHFESEDLNGIQLVHMSGPLDSATYTQCQAYLDPLINRTQLRVVLDCRGLTYMNSRGLKLLMHYKVVALQHFSFFGIARLPSHILKNIKLLHLDNILDYVPSLEEALEAAVAS
jgi:anti-anti-sigma factor